MNPLRSIRDVYRRCLQRLVRLFRRRFVLLRPADPVLFSERNGYRKSVLRVGGWRIVPAYDFPVWNRGKPLPNDQADPRRPDQ